MSNRSLMWRELPDGRLVLDGISPRRQALNRALLGSLGAIGAWLERHWLLVLNVLLGVFVSVALLDPIFFVLGWDGLASRIFSAYHLVCEQIPTHSYYLFGYQLALCARNLAIYSSLLAGSLAFRFVRDRLPALDWRLWFLTMVPMALDGGTQLFGLRESNWELRTFTGALFGLGICWFVLPVIEAAAHGDVARARVTVDLRFLRRLGPSRQQRVRA